jgi:hypothetical protein
MIMATGACNHQCMPCNHHTSRTNNHERKLSVAGARAFLGFYEEHIPDKCCSEKFPACVCGTCTDRRDSKHIKCADPAWDGDCCIDNESDCCPKGTSCCGDECIDDWQLPACPILSTCCESQPLENCCTPDVPICVCGDCVTQEQYEAIGIPPVCTQGILPALKILYQHPLS